MKRGHKGDQPRGRRLGRVLNRQTKKNNNKYYSTLITNCYLNNLKVSRAGGLLVEIIQEPCRCIHKQGSLGRLNISTFLENIMNDNVYE